MKTIIVTTDRSKNSRVGLKFAIQLASQYKVHLIFFLAIEQLVPTRWNDVKIKRHMDEEIATETGKLRLFVMETYKECRKRPGKFECVVRYGAPVSQAISAFAAETHAHYICMATRGAGGLKRIIGTHTSATIKRSPAPVFVIPAKYKTSPIRMIIYASDLNKLPGELKIVKQLAARLDSVVSVVHYDHFLNPETAKKSFEQVTRRRATSNVNFHLRKFNWEESLARHLKSTAKKFSADLVILFTDNKRNVLQRIFQTSNSVEASFDTDTPLLIYPNKGL